MITNTCTVRHKRGRRLRICGRARGARAADGEAAVPPLFRRAFVASRRGLILGIILGISPALYGETDRVLPSIWEDAPAFIYPQGLDRVEFEIPIGRRWQADVLEEAWTLAVEVDDDDPLHWEQLAVQYFALNRFDRVLAIADILDELDLTRTHTLNWILALSLEATEEWESTFLAWEKIHHAQPGDTLPLVRMVISLLHQDHLNAAHRLLRQSTLRYPHNSTLAHLLAAVYWQNANPRAAWRALARAAATPDAPVDTLLFMSWLSILNGEPDPAVGWLRRALATQQADQRLPLLAHPAFAALHERSAFELLLEEEGYTFDDLRVAQAQRAPAMELTSDEAHGERVEHRIVDRFQVSIRLQDHEDTYDPSSPLLGLPADRARAGLRLGTTEPGSNEQQIHWHDPPD